MRHIRGVCASVLVSCLLFSGAALAQTPAPPHAAGKVHVYLLRGLVNIFSLGLDSVGGKLRQHGIEASVHNHLEWLALTDEAIQACKSGRESQIILVGHSLGASAVVDMAQRLSQAGVEASLVISLDPVTRVTANGRVPRLINYYISNGVGQAIDRGSSFHGSLQNVDLKNNPEGGHIFLTNSEAMQQKIYNDVLSAVATHTGCRLGAAHATISAAPASHPPGT